MLGFLFKYLEYLDYVIDCVSKNGYVDVLDWWKLFGLKFKYILLLVNWVSVYGYIVVLEWWKMLGFLFKYYFDFVVGCGNIFYIRNVMDMVGTGGCVVVF